MMRPSCLLLLACLPAAGCSLQPRNPQAKFPMKIGVLADSQLTSQNGFSDYSQRSRFADKLVDVAIRPPSVECFLGREMLHVALQKLTLDAGGSRTGVDVILYLGDGANSGGTDEIGTLLSVLEQYRSQTNTPIFMVIGNHDYLGCGNIPTPGTRFALLNRDGQPPNPALSKYQVLERISRFNHDSGAMPSNSRFRYADNIDMLKGKEELDHDSGLYLCGVLSYAEPGKPSVEFLLLDSSDYRDAPGWSNAVELGFYGVIGSVSFQDEPGALSQLGYLKPIAQSSSPDFRLLASHYPKDHLDRVTFAKPGKVPLNVTNIVWEVTEGAFSVAKFSESLNENLKDLLSSSRRNYWLSGHTHAPTMPPSEKMIVGGLMGELHFNAINVGSTTDYRAHVAIVEAVEPYKNRRLDDAVGYREMPLCDCGGSIMAALPKAIEEFGRAHGDDPDFQWLKEPPDEKSEKPLVPDVIGVATSFLPLGRAPVKKPGEIDWMDFGASMLGLNKKYRDDRWKDKHTQLAAKYVESFATDVANKTGGDRTQVIAFLGLLAGAYENGRIPPGCEFHISFLKPLCEAKRSSLW